MTALTISDLFAKHIPSVLREWKHSDFSDSQYLNVGLRLIDEFWDQSQCNFVRHSAYRLNLEDVITFDASGHIAFADPEHLLQALLSSEIELRIRPEMTLEQSSKLAGIYECLAVKFAQLTWFEHSRFCFKRAAQLFGSLMQYAREDECWYGWSCSSLKMAKGLSRLKLLASYLISGFGYRPFRLFGLSACLMIGFAIVEKFLAVDITSEQALLLSAMSGLTAVGFGDVKDFRPTLSLIMVVHGFISLIVNSAFFALLVRKWFRA